MNKMVLTVLICALAVFSAMGQCSEAEVKALEKFDRDWGAASQNADRTALNAVYANDYRNITGNETKSIAIDNAIEQANRDKAHPEKAAKVSFGHYMITCTPTTATITHRNKVKMPGSDGKWEVAYSRSVHVLEKRNGKWQVVSNAGHGLTDEMTLAYMEMDWIDALKNRNAEWFQNNLAPDYMAASFMTGDVKSKEEAVRDIKTSKMKVDSVKILEMDVNVNGNTGIVTGIGHGVGTAPDGSAFDMKVRFMDTFVKRDGRWMPLASQATPLTAPQETVATKSN